MSGKDRVLVTGAGGFIGGRLAEVLYDSDRWEVRAGLRRWASAARIGRMPIDIVSCDVTDKDQVARAMEGVRYVVHGAQGPAGVTVEGTRNVLRAARQAGVEQVVHISTSDVYGRSEGVLDESVPPAKSGVEYGDAKIDAEAVCLEAAGDGQGVVILRPTIVYGPFGPLWMVRYAERLRDGQWPIPAEHSRGICNLVYVDDLVAAILLAMTCEAARGEAFNVNGGDRATWGDYFAGLARAMGQESIDYAPALRSRVSAALMSPVRRTASYALKNFKGVIMGIHQRSDLAKEVMRRTEHLIKKTPTTNEFEFYSRTATYPTDKAERVLGYRPHISLDRGVELCGAWLAHHGFLRSDRNGAG